MRTWPRILTSGGERERSFADDIKPPRSIPLQEDLYHPPLLLD
jgi:hypothetical protein